MTANEKKDLSVIVQLRRTTNFQAEVIRRYAKFMSDIDKLVEESQPLLKGSDLEKIDRMCWSVKLDVTKLIEIS
jgi:hypothetical protein